jgi:hypothetical protein
MKRKMFEMFVLAAVLFLSATYAYAQECDVWKGIWEVKKTNGATVQWVIDKATRDTGSSFLPCKATGKEKATGKADSDIQIIWVTFANGYVYYQGTEAPGMTTPCSQLGDLKAPQDAFTAAAPKDLGIASGKKLGASASTPEPPKGSR